MFRKTGVPSAQLRSLFEVFNCARVQSRSFVQCLDDGLGMPTLKFRINNISFYTPKSYAPYLGEHVADVLASLNKKKLKTNKRHCKKYVVKFQITAD